jgi:hypothetical protein
MREKPILSSERMLYKDYDRKVSVTKNNLVMNLKEQDELTGCKPPVLK